MKNTPVFDTDVLIVGSGPTGTTTALALARYGIRSHTITRWNWLADTPRAHITNQRTMEVFRDLGLEEDIHRLATPWDNMGDMLFTTSLAGEELVRLRTWGTGEERKGDYLKGSPCGMVDIIQPKLEPILLKNAAERGARFTFNAEYLSHSQDADGVTVRVKDRLCGREYSLRAKYLVGADGAKSIVMDDAGLVVEGRMARAGTAYAIFNADLTKYAKHRPSVLYWIVTSAATFGELGVGLLRAVKPWTQWIAGWGIDIEKGDPDLSESAVHEKIYALVGDSSIKIDVIRTTVWYVNQAFAPTYSKGRVFCGGDAVHRHPPSSGLGLNTSVQDAFNLAWKIAYTLKGYAGPRLLDTYSSERAPVGKQTVDRANQSRLDYGPLNACFRVEGAENPVLAGVARLKDPGPEGLAVRQRIQDALVHKNTEFNAQGVEMNQRYVSNAVLPDSGSLEEQWVRDRTLYLQPTTRPGAKLPHAWLVNEEGIRVSTLDVTGNGLFSLITGLAGGAWQAAAQRLDLPYVRVIVIGLKGTLDPYYEWQRIREIEEAGAILVRPDGYVAWRECAPVYDIELANQKLCEAIATILDHAGVAGQTTRNPQ